MIAATFLALLPLLASAAPVLNGTTAPAPPVGGVDANATAPAPVYAPADEFDFESLALALHQEWIELDLFQYGLEKFSDEEFDKYGINTEQRSLISFMAQQEVGHAQLIANMLNSATNTTGAPGRCTYAYDFETVPAFLDFCQRLTRWGESGVLGFLSHLNARPTAQLLVQSITTESRQQMIFRQMMGLFPMPVYFEVGIPQAYAWSLLNPYIVECPATNSPIKWQAFPALTVENGPSAIDEGFQALPYPDGGSAVSHNRTALTYPGREVELSWAAPGYATGPYNQTTAVGAQVNTNASSPLFVAWVSQLNVTYTPLTLTGDFTGTTYQPNGTVFPETPDDPIVNGTSFVAITSADPYLTPFNLSLINDFTVAGPAIYQAS